MIGIVFILMILDDTEPKRKLFWRAYCCYILLVTLYQLFFWIAPLSEDDDRRRSEIDEYCTEFGKVYGWGEDGAHVHYFSKIECVYERNHDMIRNQLIRIVVPMFIQLYFCFIIFTNWKNASLPRSKGGCVEVNVPRQIEINGP